MSGQDVDIGNIEGELVTCTVRLGRYSLTNISSGRFAGCLVLSARRPRTEDRAFWLWFLCLYHAVERLRLLDFQGLGDPDMSFVGTSIGSLRITTFTDRFFLVISVAN